MMIALRAVLSGCLMMTLGWLLRGSVAGSRIKITINVVLSWVLLICAASLMERGYFVVPSKSIPGQEIVFRGASLWALVSGITATGVFALLVAHAWSRGTLPEGGFGEPEAKGQILWHFRYVVGVIAVSLVVAYATSSTVPLGSTSHGVVGLP